MTKKLLSFVATLILLPTMVYAESRIIPGYIQKPIFITVPNGAQKTESDFKAYFYLNNDEKKCKEKYGKNFWNMCRRPLGLQGRKIDFGITMTPAIEGEWRWESDYEFSFKPKTAWIPDTTYTVQVEKGLMPDHVFFTKDAFIFKTLPVTPKISDMRFLQDPQDPKKKVVTATVFFNYPVKTDEFEKRTAFFFQQEKSTNNQDTVQTLKQIPFKVTYNEKGTEAYLTAHLDVLPKTEKFLMLEIAPGVMARDGEKGSPKQVRERLRVPSVSTFYKINKVQSLIVRNDQYQPQQVLALNLSVKTSPKEVQKGLRVYALPKYHPVSGKNKKSTDPAHQWKSVQELNPTVLKQLKKVPLRPLPVQGDHTDVHTYEFNQLDSGYLYVEIEKGVKAFGGYHLATDYKAIVPVAAYRKELEIMTEGALMSLSGSKTLPIFARGQKEIRYEVARVRPDFINTLVSQTGGNFENPYFKNYSLNETNLSEVSRTDKTLPYKSQRAEQFTSFDFSNFVTGEKKGLFFFKVHSKDKDDLGSERIGNQTDSRFVLVTDLGFLVKTNADNSQDVFVLSVNTGKPVNGAKVAVLGQNGVPIYTGETSHEGRVHLPNFSMMKREKSPVAYVVTKGDDLSFMPFTHGGRRLNYSNFDVSGVHAGKSGLKAYLFSDRGVYRPGEVIEVGMIVKPQTWEKDITGLPIHLRVTDSTGKRVREEILKVTAEGLSALKHQTSSASSTGNYTFALYLDAAGKRGSFLNSLEVRVEEFLPDRLRMKSAFNKVLDGGWVSPDDLQAHITLMNLFGTPAPDRRVTGRVTLNPGLFYFKKYKDYRFFDAKSGSGKEFSMQLSDQQTDLDGKATFKLDMDRFENTSYTLTMVAQGFEAGAGRGVAVLNRILVSPLKYVVGVKTDADLSRLKQGGKHTLEFIAVDAALSKINIKKMTAQLKRKSYINTLVQKDNGQFQYEAIVKEVDVDQQIVSISQTGLKLPLKTEKGGEYILRLLNDQGAVVSKVEFIVAGGPRKLADKKNALNVSLNKANYTAGEDIEVTIAAPYTGAGLITIESDKVVKHRFFKSSKTSFDEKITIPKAFSGKGYINVAFVRDINSKEIHMNPLTYAVVPFMVDAEKRTVELTVEAPETVKPGETFDIKYKSSKSAKIILYGVDEGILQVANYVTPDPVRFFFKNRALEVRTSQILDLLMPEFNVFKAVSAFGGGGDVVMSALTLFKKKSGASMLNPFARAASKPAVFWSGILEANSTEQTFKAQVPSTFNGTMRVMAVAASKEQVGKAETHVISKGPFVILPNTPLFAAPQDEFVISTTISNNLPKESNGNVDYAIQVSPGIEIIEGSKGQIKIPVGQEKTVSAKVRATHVIGTASITFTVTGGGQLVSRTESVSIRPLMPNSTQSKAGILQPGEIKSLAMPRQFYEALKTQAFSVSALPLGVLKGLVKYLETYPHTCTEQSLSRAIPAILMYQVPELALKQEELEKRVEEAIATLRANQSSDGGFSAWRHGKSDPFVTAYAVDFMTLAQEKGLPMPTDMLNRGLAYLRNMVNTSVMTLDDGRVKAYGIYVLTRNGEVTTNYLINVMTDLEKYFKNYWRDDLTAVYVAATYKLMQQDQAAEEILNAFAIGEPKNWYGYTYYGGLVKYSQYVSILARHFPKRLATMKPDVIFRVAADVTAGMYNTLSAAYGVGAILDYSLAQKVTDSGVSFTALGEGNKALPLTLKGKRLKQTGLTGEVQEVRLKAGKVPLFYQMTTSGFTRELPHEPLHNGLEITKTFHDADGKEIQSVELGKEVTVKIRARSYDNRRLESVAIVDLLPGGFDLVIDKVGEGSSMGPDHVEKREDRLVIYTTVRPDERFFSYKMRAVNEGSFMTPPSYGESMYENILKSMGVAGTLAVIPQVQR